MNPDITNKITDIENRLKAIEDNRWIFPQRLGQLDKKSMNNVMFIFGSVTITGSGFARATYPNLNPNMIIVAGYSSGAPISPLSYIIQASTVIPGQFEILFSGDIGLDVDFVVFLTSEKIT